MGNGAAEGVYWSRARRTQQTTPLPGNVSLEDPRGIFKAVVDLEAPAASPPPRSCYPDYTSHPATVNGQAEHGLR